MPTGKITEKRIDAECRKAERTGKAAYLWDTELRGFGCYISAKGKVSWLFQRWVGGKGGRPNRFVIGQRPPWSVERARAEAEVYSGQASGNVPLLSPRKQRIQLDREAMAATKLKDAWELYSLKKGDDSTHWQWTQRKFQNVILPELGASTALLDISKSEVISLIDGIEKEYPVSARYTFACLRPFFSWCVSRQYISLSPMMGLESPAVPESRDRFLSEQEIKAFWKATGDMGYPWLGFYRLLLLTGQRREEVSGMKWSEIDTTTGTWTIPSSRTKNGKEHIVHLSDEALYILGTLPVIDSDYVFTTTLVTPISGYGRAKERLDKLMPTEKPWRVHDLRRTFVTMAHENGLGDPHVIEAAINHVTGAAKAGVAGTYNRAAYLKERRALMDSWGEYLSDLVNPKPTRQPSFGNVIPFGTRRPCANG